MARKFQITDASGGAGMMLRIIARSARKTQMSFDPDATTNMDDSTARTSTIKIRLANMADSDEADNEEIIAFLADVVDVDPSQIEIVPNNNADFKMIGIHNISPEYLEERLRAAIHTDAD
ncbi:MAG: hypothetical protein ACLFTK_10300 [Anaerolineales bacterium]